MKKAILFLMIVFIIGGVYMHRFPITATAAFNRQDKPAGGTAASATTGGAAKGAPAASNPKPPKTGTQSQRQLESGDSPASTDGGQKKLILKAKLQELIKKAKTKLSLKGDRADEVRKLQEDLDKLDERLADTKDAGALDGIGQELSGLQVSYDRLFAPSGSVAAQPGAGPDSAGNEAKTALLTKIKGLEEKVNGLDKEGPKKADIAKLIGDIDALKSQISKAELTDSGQIDTFDKKITGLSDRYQKIASDETSPSSSLLEWVLYGVIGLLVLGGTATGIYFLLKKREDARVAIRNTFSQLKARNSTFNEKLETLTKITTDLSQQVAQQKSDISRLRQGLASQPAYAPEPVAPVQAREQPRFPVAVEDYLAKVQGSRPVKFDYKEAMLVPDTESTGGMLLVQDDGQLYLIPSFKFFQTKSDYSNYLERYFDCARPMAGTVWIRQPATVTKSGSGWQVVTKGDLEVR